MKNEVVVAAQEWCRGQGASIVVQILAFFLVFEFSFINRLQHPQYLA